MDSCLFWLLCGWYVTASPGLDTAPGNVQVLHKLGGSCQKLQVLSLDKPIMTVCFTILTKTQHSQQKEATHDKITNINNKTTVKWWGCNSIVTNIFLSLNSDDRGCIHL